MSQSKRKSNNHTGENSNAKDRIEQRLLGVGVRIDRSVNVADGTKECRGKGHSNASNQTFPGLIDGNYAIHGGDGLVILDIDVPREDLPDWVADLPSTFVVKSPHGGYHYYYAIENEEGISNSSLSCGSVRYDGWYALGPGSTIDHELCPHGKENCPGHGVDEYTVETDNPIATPREDHLEALREATASDGDARNSKEEYGGDQITLPDDALADEGERYICTEFTCRRDTGGLAGRELMDLLRGGTGSYELRRDDGTGIDRSAADYYALEALYGAFLFRGEDEDEARRLSLSVFKRYCRENPHDKTGSTRKWLARGEGYLQEQMVAVQKDYNPDEWHRWRRRDHENGFNASEHTPWADPSKDGNPSLITQDTIRATLHILTSDLDPEYVARQYGLDTSSLPPDSRGEMFTPQEGSTSSNYPTAKEVGKAAAELNPERKASYFAETLKRLSRETNEVTHAYCPSRPNGERHVYYHSGQTDPEDARWVKSNGEEREPDPTEKYRVGG